ncbi:hypothetical protein [Aquitalea aquatica]|uniref:Uncharacterized protein n=1 Tax=Aquitalea aquatica TaxID=3044273 RepID=A0A838YJ22_9NEIS|nr:hypothetical protein [Aquitalea magnusonii]MBA4710571.1 hypothetical protein [Aquitalea magnusonii]
MWGGLGGAGGLGQASPPARPPRGSGNENKHPQEQVLGFLIELRLKMLLILFLFFGAANFMFHKRLCHLTGEEFYIFTTPNKVISSKLHIALFFGYFKYKDTELTQWAITLQVLASVFIAIILKN